MLIDDLYWTALSRPPTDKERGGTVQYLSLAGDRRAKFEDVLWGIMNSNEFLLRR